MPGVRVGRHSRIRNAIIDRDVLIPRGAIIGYNAEEDRRRHTVSDGGVVVVTLDEEPLVGPVDGSALHVEARADGTGHGGLNGLSRSTPTPIMERRFSAFALQSGRSRAASNPQADRSIRNPESAICNSERGGSQ